MIAQSPLKECVAGIIHKLSSRSPGHVNTTGGIISPVYFDLRPGSILTASGTERGKAGGLQRPQNLVGQHIERAACVVVDLVELNHGNLLNGQAGRSRTLLGLGRRTCRAPAVYNTTVAALSLQPFGSFFVADRSLPS